MITLVRDGSMRRITYYCPICQPYRTSFPTTFSPAPALCRGNMAGTAHSSSNSMYTDIPSHSANTAISNNSSNTNNGSESTSNSNNKRAYTALHHTSSSTTTSQAASVAVVSTNNSSIKDYFPANKILKSGGGSDLSLPHSRFTSTNNDNYEYEGEGKGVIVYDLTSDTSDDQCEGSERGSVYDNKENIVNRVVHSMPTLSSSSGACLPHTHACTNFNSCSMPCQQSYHSSYSHTSAHMQHSNTSYTSSSSNTVPITDTYSSSYSNNTSNHNNATSVNNTHTPIQAPIVPTTTPATISSATKPPPSYNSASLDYLCNFLYQPLCSCPTNTSTTTSTTPTTHTTANKKPTKLSRVRKIGPNLGRLFWSCAGTRNSTKCNSFLWADKLFPTCKCTIQPNTTTKTTTNINNSTTNTNRSICIIRRVLKPGPTNGCYFFTCSNTIGCGYFIWAHVYNQTFVPITGAAGVQLLSQYDIPL